MRMLPDIARETAERFGMLPPDAPVVALVSGGADSTSLLCLLTSGALGERPLRVLHVNHLLRGDAADADEAFVLALCRRLGVPCRTVRYDVSAYAEAEGLNLEDAGRRVRYRFAEEEAGALAAEHGLGPHGVRIAVAHTFDDRVETLLMRLATGTGMRGLLGLRPVRGRIVRPLIEASKADVIAYLTSSGQDWREDETNADTTRLRAAVRTNLLPELRAVNPRFDSGMARTFTILTEEDELLEEMADGFADAFADQRQGEVELDLAFMRTLTRPMLRRVLRELLDRAFPEAGRLEFEHIEALADGVAQERFARDLPCGLRAWSEYGKMFLSRTPGSMPPVPPSLLEVPGATGLGGSGSIVVDRVAPAALSPDPAEAVIDAATVRGPLVVDGPREGDRMRPLGMAGTKLVSDLLSEAKVPRRERPGRPVVRDGETVVWVAGVRLSDEHKVTPATTEALRLRWLPPQAE